MMLHKVWDTQGLLSAVVRTQNQKMTSQNFGFDLYFMGPHLHFHDSSKGYLNFQSIILMISMHDSNEKYILSIF